MAEIKKVWWVKDPTEDSEQWEDFLWEVETKDLGNLIRGNPNAYEDEHTKLYDDESSAFTEAKKRWEKVKKTMVSKGKTSSRLEGEKAASVVTRFKGI